MTTSDYRRAAQTMHEHRRVFQKHPAVEFDIRFQVEVLYKKMIVRLHSSNKAVTAGSVILEWRNSLQEQEA